MSTTPTLARLSTVSLVAFLGGLILLVCGLSGVDDFGPTPPLAAFFGWFFLIVSLIFYVIHLVFTLMRDHEVWKRSLDPQSDDRFPEGT
ncbi:MAG TPA: hypothetical protein VFC19_01300 [Candidatus Limnocylindrales bacterium]|nr:hypothetical protein [Candidatus Limnocylindrales bacterium]